MLIDWMEYNGVEIANSTRTRQYAKQFGLGWLRGCGDCDGVGDAIRTITGQTYLDVKDAEGRNPPAARTYDDLLHSGPGGAVILYGDMRDTSSNTYSTPQRDKPHWFDIDDADTWGFLGFLPMEVSGMEDSTRLAEIQRKVASGAVISPLAFTERTVYVRGLLVGIDHASVMAGMSWLRNVTQSNLCDPAPACEGGTLRYFASCPVLCDDAPNCIDECVTPYIRTLYDATITTGPTVLRDFQLDGGLIEVDFILTSGNPFTYSNPKTVIEHSPAVPAAKWADMPVPIPTPRTGTGPDQCFIDPACPPVPSFPGMPAVDPGCGHSDIPDDNTSRLEFTLAADKVPQWARAVPVMKVHANSQDHQAVRVRFRSERGGPDSEFLITWLPSGGTMSLDAVQDMVTLSCNGLTRNAEHLVVADSSGAPVRWPVVTCGDSWTVIVDVPKNENPDDLSIGVDLRVRDG